MIKVSRLKGKQFVVNADLIKYVESTPDTMLTMETGERVFVAESVDEVIRRVVEFRRLIRLLPEE